jgi:hypothetical protein
VKFVDVQISWRIRGFIAQSCMVGLERESANSFVFDGTYENHTRLGLVAMRIDLLYDLLNLGVVRFGLAEAVNDDLIVDDKRNS